MALLDLVATNYRGFRDRYLPRANWPDDFVVAHLDHGIRPESAADAAFVKKRCKDYGVRCIISAAKLGSGISEEIARMARQIFFDSVVVDWDLKCTKQSLRRLRWTGQTEQYEIRRVTAHHQDDLLETAIMFMLRGTGWRGLASMTDDEIIRPLLDWTKVEITKYMLEHDLPWVQDQTNFSPQYFRNRIRMMLESWPDSDKARLLSLIDDQRQLVPSIDKATTDYICNHAQLATSNGAAEINRYDIIMLPDNVALEVLRLLTSGNLTRPQLTKLLLFIRTAKPNKKIHFDDVQISVNQKSVILHQLNSGLYDKIEAMKPEQKRPIKRPTGNNSKKSGRKLKNIIFYTIIVGLIIAIFATLRLGTKVDDIAFSDLVHEVNDGKVAKIVESGSNLTVYMKGDDGKAEELPSKASRIPSGASATEQGLNLDKVEYVVTAPDTTGDVLWNMAAIFLPVLLMVFLFAWMMRQAGAQNNQSMSFGRSKAKLYGQDKAQTKFSEIAGNDNAKQDLGEVVDFLKHPQKFLALGAKIPKGVLLVGPPGTGKTMMARAVAGEAGVPFFSISGSEFVEMFVGVGASRVRDLFEKAKKNAPCIIFIDEIDAVGRRRGSGMGGGHDEREQTLNQILVEMDGFEKDQNVIVLAATNRADILDKALLRPGRFDRRVNITLPERPDRLAILKVHFRNKPVVDNLDLESLAAKTAGMSGADLANIANEAAIRAARLNRKQIDNSDITEAFEKVAIGSKKKNMMREKDRILTAYHEGGHALVAEVLPHSDNVHKVTIIPRGGTGGVTWTLPEYDRAYASLPEYKDDLAKAMGGRIAEEVIYGRNNITSGASSDLRNASSTAREMVMELGMGSKLRDQAFHQDEGGLVMDQITHEKPYSEKTAEEIDREVSEILVEATNRARAIITANRDLLERLKDALMEKETLEADEVAEILGGVVLPDEAKLD